MVIVVSDQPRRGQAFELADGMRRATTSLMGVFTVLQFTYIKQELKKFLRLHRVRQRTQ